MLIGRPGVTYHDVELRCSSCGHETLATAGCYEVRCSHCPDGTRVVVREHDHVLTGKEAEALGYVLGGPGPY